MPEERQEQPSMEPPAEPSATQGEHEVDAPEDSRPRLAAGVARLNLADSTLNVMPVNGGRMVMTLLEGGFQCLLAGCRAAVGQKAGRYMFEVAIVETLHAAEVARSQKPPQPKQLLRLGLSTANSSLLLGDGADNVCFDNDGYFTTNGQSQKASRKFNKGQTAALMVNLDASSKHANTVSLFVDGQRVSEPQPLPEGMIGKPLFPTITFRSITVQINFGPCPKAKLPFTCRMLADAASADVDVVPAQDAKCEVLFPVGLPDQGYFDWVDQFLAKNPTFTELSDRKIFDWAEKSGLWKGRNAGHGSSSDKPEPRFGVHMLDDFSIREVLRNIAPAVKRNYIIPELTSNLLATDRKQVVQCFPQSDFKRKSCIIMGQPTADFKSYIQGLMLEAKKAKAEEERSRQARKRGGKWDDAKLDKPADKQEDASTVQGEGKQDGAEDATGGEKGSGAAVVKKVDDVEMKDVAADDKEATKSDTAPADSSKGDGVETEDVVQEVVLTEEEQKAAYRSLDIPDVNERVLLRQYANFTLPSTEEGFDDISFPWQDEESCRQHLKAWVMEKKTTQRAEELQPGQAFKDRWTQWRNLLEEWRRLQNDWKDPSRRRVPEKKEGEEAPPEINADDIEVFDVKDIRDLGNGEPLFANFVYEDWTLLSTRFELHLLIHSFRKDLNDPDRPSFREAHLAYYYEKYFGKLFDIKYFGVDSFADFIDLIKDIVTIDEKTSFLTPVLGEDTPMDDFMKYTEEHRRERQQRIDAGDETAKLKFEKPPPPAVPTEGAAHGSRSEHRASKSRSDYRGGGDYRGGSSGRDYRGGSSGRDYRSGGDHRGGGSGGGDYRSSGGDYRSSRGSYHSSGGKGGGSRDYGGSRGGYSSQSGSFRGQEKRPYPGSTGGGGGYGSAAKSARVGGGGYGGGKGGYARR